MKPVSAASLFILMACGAGCAGSPPSATSPTQPRTGHTYSNGNCAIDADRKLTGLCEGSDRDGRCTTHAPGPDSKPCPTGVVVTDTRPASCSGKGSEALVSREHECNWLSE